MNKLKSKGFTLIEFIVFISIISVLGTGILVTFINVLRFSGDPNKLIQSNALSQSRMEIILFARQNNYTNLADPCTPPTTYDICTKLSTFASKQGFSQVTSSITPNSQGTTKIIQIMSSHPNVSNYSLETSVSAYE